MGEVGEQKAGEEKGKDDPQVCDLVDGTDGNALQRDETWKKEHEAGAKGRGELILSTLSLRYLWDTTWRRPVDKWRSELSKDLSLRDLERKAPQAKQVGSKDTWAWA